jgi:hypothetical protein
VTLFNRENDFAMSHSKVARAHLANSSRPNERQKLQVDTPRTGFATLCVTESSSLYLQLTLLRSPSDAPGDRPSSGVIEQGRRAPNLGVDFLDGECRETPHNG